MEFKELDNPKRVRDGVVCVVDSCVSVGTGKNYEVKGEFCSECECGFPPDQVTRENEEIALIRLKYKNSKLE